MHGFIGIVNNNSNFKPISIRWKENFPFQTAHLIRNFVADSYQIEQFSVEKFPDKKIWIDTDEILCVTEGLILNLDKLLLQNSVSTFDKLLLAMYAKSETFFEQFEGSFVGFCYLKKEKKWIIFNNRTGTKHLFYFQNKSYFIFSTDLFTLSNALKELKIKYRLLPLAGRLMVNNGFLLEDITWIENVKKLRAGEYCEFSEGKLSQDFYFHLEQIQKINLPKNELIDKLDLKFSKALKSSLEIDVSNNFAHLTTLSGGLDSRLVVFNGLKNGFTNQNLLNFSQSDYADHLIAKQIATSLKMPFSHYNLTSKLLMEIDNVVAVNDGVGVYTDCSHVFSVVSQLDAARIGMIHTGIMGDTIMGSSANRNEDFYKNRLYASKKPHQEVKSYVDSVLNRYQNPEMAYIYNAIFTNESNGFLYFDLIGSTFSPFLYNDFLQFAFSIPDKFRKDRNIYVDWMNKLYPKSTDFVWEAIGGKPTNNTLKRFFYRLNRAFVKRLSLQSMWHYGMNPENIWYEQDGEVKSKLDSYFQSYIELIEDISLQNELYQAYNFGDFDAKARVLTVLAAVKLLF